MECSYRIWVLTPARRIALGIELSKDVQEVKCHQEGTEMITYTHPKMIETYGETEYLCRPHYREQQRMERLSYEIDAGLLDDVEED